MGRDLEEWEITPGIGYFDPLTESGLILLIPKGASLGIFCTCDRCKGTEPDVYSLNPIEHPFGDTVSASEFLWCWRYLFLGAYEGSD